jgi:hypothetical protein
MLVTPTSLLARLVGCNSAHLAGVEPGAHAGVVRATVEFLVPVDQSRPAKPLWLEFRARKLVTSPTAFPFLN